MNDLSLFLKALPAAGLNLFGLIAWCVLLVVWFRYVRRRLELQTFDKIVAKADVDDLALLLQRSGFTLGPNGISQKKDQLTAHKRECLLQAYFATLSACVVVFALAISAVHDKRSDERDSGAAKSVADEIQPQPSLGRSRSSVSNKYFVDVAYDYAARKLNQTPGEMRKRVERYVAHTTSTSDITRRALAAFFKGNYSESENLYQQASLQDFENAEQVRGTDKNDVGGYKQFMESAADNAIGSARACWADGNVSNGLVQIEGALVRIKKEDLQNAFVTLETWRGKCHGELAKLGNDVRTHLGLSGDAYQLALDALKEDRDGPQWAFVQGNLAAVLVARSGYENSKDRIGLITNAINRYNLALSKLSSTENPKYWAFCHRGLGIALEALAKQNTDENQMRSLLEKAKKSFDDSLSVQYSVDEFSTAAGEANLGNVLGELADITRGDEGSNYLDSSIVALEKATTDSIRNIDPLFWAGGKRNLGVTLWQKAKRVPHEQADQLCENAISNLIAATNYITLKSAPNLWADIHGNLGNAYTDLAGRTNGPKAASLAEMAVKYIKQTERVYRPEGDTFFNWGISELNLSGALLIQSRNSDGEAAKRLAEQAYTASTNAIEVFKKDPNVGLRISAEGNAAIALVRIAFFQEGRPSTDSLYKSIDFIGDIMSSSNGSESVNVTADAQLTLGEAYELMAKRKPDEEIPLLQKAKQAYQTALKKFGENSFGDTKQAEDAIMRIEKLLEKKPGIFKR